jgi:hypothetical protein
MSEHIPLDPDRDEGSAPYGAPSHDEIARRAYEISQSDEAGTPDEDWRRAERDLRRAERERRRRDRLRTTRDPKT